MATSLTSKTVAHSMLSRYIRDGELFLANAAGILL
jgi:hypothetical protein